MPYLLSKAANRSLALACFVALISTLNAQAIPVAANDLYPVRYNHSNSGNVCTNDILTLGAKAFIVLNPLHGTVGLQTNGDFTYTPTAGFSGKDRFTYKLIDSLGNESNVGTANLSVLTCQTIQITGAHSDNGVQWVFGGDPNTKVNVIVSIQDAAPAAVSVPVSCSDTTRATVPATVAIASGQSTGTFAVTHKKVATTGYCRIDASYNGYRVSAYLLVAAATPYRIDFTPGAVTGGDGEAASLKVTLRGPAPSGGSVVSLLSSNPSAATCPATLTVPAGNTTASVAVTHSYVSADNSVNFTASGGGDSGSNSLTVKGYRFNGFSIVGPVEVQNLPGVLTPSIIGCADPAGIYNTALASVTVNAPAPAAGLSLPISFSTVSGLTGVVLPASITIPKGQTSAKFPVQVRGSVPPSPTDPNVHSDLGVTVRVGGSDSITATVHVYPVMIESILLPDGNQVFGGQKVTAELRLAGVAPSAGMNIALSSNSTLATIPKSVTVPSGASNVAFSVTTKPTATTAGATIQGDDGAHLVACSFAILPAEVSDVYLDSYSISQKADGMNIQGILLLDGAAAASGNVSVLSDTPSVIPTTTVPVAALGTSANFTLVTKPVPPGKTVTVYLQFYTPSQKYPVVLAVTVSP